MNKALLCTVCASLLHACGRVAFDKVDDAAGTETSDATSATCPTFALFCDGFESGDISRWPGSNLSSGGTVMVSTSVVHSGTYALDATMPPLTDGAAAQVNYTFPTQTTGRLALREYVFMPEQLDNYDGVIQFTGAILQYVGLYVANDVWAVSEDSASGGLADNPTTVAAAPGRWYCVELEVLFSPPTVMVYIDDMPVLTAPMADPGPFYNEAAGGVTRASANGGHAIIDDVVIANQHIGCL